MFLYYVRDKTNKIELNWIEWSKHLQFILHPIVFPIGRILSQCSFQVNVESYTFFFLINAPGALTFFKETFLRGEIFGKKLAKKTPVFEDSVAKS